MTTLTACQQKAVWLTEARAALHTLSIGGTLARVTQADKTMEWHAGNRLDLVRYVQDLERQVDACNGRRTRGGFIQMTPSDC